MAITLYNRTQLKDKFKNGSFSTEDKFSALIDSLYNRSDDSVLQGPLGYVNTSGVIGPTGGTHYGLYVGYGSGGNIGKVIILPEGIQIYNTVIGGWVTLGTHDTLASNTVYSTQDFFTLRHESAIGLTSGYSGLKIENFDGSGNNAIVAIDKDGNFLLGPENNPGIVPYRETPINDNSFIYWSNETTRLMGSNIYIDPLTNKIGIGKTGPLYDLDINGDLNFSGNFYQNGAPFIGSEWTTNSSCLYYLGNVSIGGTQSTHKLTVEGDLKTTGTVEHTGLVTTEGFNIDQVKTITRNLVLTGDWQDVGINSTDIETGTYLIQLYANDSWQGGSNDNEYYSGILSWYSGEVKNPMELPNDEIILHRSGGGSDGGLYLRTYKYVPGDIPGYIKLQIYSNFSNIQSSNYVFRFRRML